MEPMIFWAPFVRSRGSRVYGNGLDPDGPLARRAYASESDPSVGGTNQLALRTDETEVKGAKQMGKNELMPARRLQP